MEEMDILEDFDPIDGAISTRYKGKAPGGLIALCVLTIVGSVAILLKDFFTYQLYAATNEIASSFQGNEQIDLFRRSQLNWLPWVYLLETISCIATIVGAALMLGLKKIGFAIHVAGTILYCIAIIWFWFVAMKLQLNEGLIMLLLVYLIVPIGFIIMYSANRRYLN